MYIAKLQFMFECGANGKQIFPTKIGHFACAESRSSVANKNVQIEMAGHKKAMVVGVSR
jgi:hypothetical protein